jgi:hypothetical protein
LKLKLVTRDVTGNVIPVDLSTAASVTFSMSKSGKDGVALFTNNMTILEAINGIVVYLWQDGDLGTVGKYRGWITVNWTGTERETKGDLEITVKQRPA